MEKVEETDGWVAEARFPQEGLQVLHPNNLTPDYKNPEMLRRYITERGKILPARIMVAVQAPESSYQRNQEGPRACVPSV
jgi:ribosomal protein S18